MKRIIVAIWTCCLFIAGGYAQDVTVTDIQVDAAGQLGYKVLEHYNAFEEVQGLRIAGPINDEDWKTLKEMFNLEELYMDEAEFSEVPNEQFNNSSGSYSLRTVTLPYSCERIGYYAFYNCYQLNSIAMPGVTYIDYNAFWYCNNLYTVDCNNVAHIENRAFYSCRSLQSIDLPNVTYIGNSTFSYCNSLQSIDLPSVTYIGSNAFYHCNQLTSVTLSDQLTELQSECFKNCRSLTSITLPAALTSIPEGAFDNCNNIREIVCQAPVPPHVGEHPFSNEVIYAATVHTQAASQASYQADAFWGRFAHWTEGATDIAELNLYNNFILPEHIRLNKLNLTVQPGYGFTLNGEDGQAFESVTLVANDNGCGTFLSHSPEVSSDRTVITYAMRQNTWYYISLPFNADITALTTTPYVQLAIYDYDGEARALNGTGGSWRRITQGSLQAGKGYIIQPSSDTEVVFTAEGTTGNTALSCNQAVTLQLDEWPSDRGVEESGWNFIGNPYPTCFNIHHLNFTAPISVWTGSTYRAYSITDDDLVLMPLQPFFVQCPENERQLTFEPEGRQATPDVLSPARQLRTKVYTARRLINLVLSANGIENDRTRIVINPEASDDYETACDAAKLFSMDEGTAQLWTLRDATNYAINEGPQTEGQVAIGIYTPQVGEYTLSVVDTEEEVVLHDRLTGKNTVLNREPYTFQVADKSRTTDRFTLLFPHRPTGITSVPDTHDVRPSHRYTLSGQRVKDSDNQPAGVYISKGKKIWVR